MSVQPMVLELIDGTDGTEHGSSNAYVEFHPDGSATLIGEIRFGVLGFVDEATWTLRYAWQERTKPEAAFRLPGVDKLDPMHVVLIKSVTFDKGELVEASHVTEA